MFLKNSSKIEDVFFANLHLLVNIKGLFTQNEAKEHFDYLMAFDNFNM